MGDMVWDAQFHQSFQARLRRLPMTPDDASEPTTYPAIQLLYRQDQLLQSIVLGPASDELVELHDGHLDALTSTFLPQGF